MFLLGRRASKDPKESKDPKDPGKSQLRRRATEDDARSGTNKTSQPFHLRRADSIAVPTSKQSDSSSQKSRSSSKKSSDEGRGRPRRSFFPISTSTSAPVTESLVNAEPATSVDSEEPVFIKTPRSARSEDGGNSPQRNDSGDRKDDGDRRSSNSKDSKEKEREADEQPREASPTVKDRFVADISSPGFSQFPMQYDGSIPGPGPSPLVPPSPNLSPPVQQQFPGQSPPYAGHPASGAASPVVPPSPNFDPHFQQPSPGQFPPHVGQPAAGAPSPMAPPLPNFDPRVQQQFPGQFPMQYDGSVPAAGGPGPVAPPSPSFDPHVHQQFPGQFPQHVGQPAPGASSPVVPPSPSPNPGVQQQFPGQLPPYVGQPPRPHNPAGEAADYYGDHGESVLTQPGVRPNPPPLIVGADPHLMPAAATPNPPPEPSSMGQVGAAASYYANNPELDQAVEEDQQQQQQQQQQHVKPPGLAPAASSPMEPPKPPRPEMPHQPSTSTAPTSAAGGSTSTTPGQSTTAHSHSVGIALGAAVVGAAAGYAMGHHHSSSSDSTPQYSPTTTHPHTYCNEAPTEATAQPGHHGSSSHTNTAMLGAGVTAEAAGYAAASAAHPYHAHGIHTPSSSSSPASQSGSMVFVRRPNRPFDKFIDWWRDTEGVGQFEEYTERIGICRDCFEPGTSPKDAPRRHHYRRRRRSSGGSSSNRIHKVSSRSSSSSSGSSRRSGKSGNMMTAAWLGAAGLAGYVAKTLFDKISFNNSSDDRSRGEKDENTNRRSERSRSRDCVEKGTKKRRSRSTPRTKKERRQSSDSSDSSYVRSRPSMKGEKKKKRQSSSSDSSGSYIDISRSNDMSGLTGFLSAPSQNQHRSGRRRTSDKSVSSSSTDEDLVFGPAFLRKPEPSKSDKRKKKETKNEDWILGLGKTSSIHDSRKNRKESIAAKESQSRPRRRSDISSAPTDEDSQREDAASGASSASAYDGSAAVDSSPESLASEPGTSKWSWLWGSKKGKEKRMSTPSDEYDSTALEASQIHQSQDATSSAESLQPVFPEPTADPSQYDATPIMSPSSGSTMVPPPSQPPRLVRPGQPPPQQPQPITPVSQSVYSPLSGLTQTHPAPTDPPVFTDPFASRDSFQFQDTRPREASIRAPRRRDTSPSEEFQPSALKRRSTMRDQASFMQLDPTEEQEDGEWRADRRDRRRRERESSRQNKKPRSVEEEDGARLDADRRERRPRERAEPAQNYSYPASSPESQRDSPREEKRPSSSPSAAAPAAVQAIGGATSAASVAGKGSEDDASEGSQNRHEERREKRREGRRPTSESEEERQPSKLSPIIEEEEQQPQPLVQLVDREEDLRGKTRTGSPPAKIPTSRITSKSSAGPVHDSKQAFFTTEELQYTGTGVDPRERPGAPRIIEIEPANERFAREMARSSSEGKDTTTGKQHTDLPWPVPQLKLTEPSPPHSHNGPVRDGTSPVVAPVGMVDKEKDEVGDRQEPERQSFGSRVSWEEQQMHEYESSETDSELAKEPEPEPEPELSDGNHEAAHDTLSVVTTTSDKSTSDHDAPNSAVEAKTDQEPTSQEKETPGKHDDDIEFVATLAAGAAAAGFDPSIVTDDPMYHKRSSPLGSEEKGTYHHSWTENEAPPVQDFKEGQTEKPTHSYDQGIIPHKAFIEGQELSAELEQIESASTNKDVYPHTPDEHQAAEEPSITRQDIEQLDGQKKEPSAVIDQSRSLQGTLEQPKWKAENKRDKEESSSADEASLREVPSQPEVDEHGGGYSSRTQEGKERGRKNRYEKSVEADRAASNTEKNPKPSADGEQPFLGERPEMPAESTANTTPGDNDGGASGLAHPSSPSSRADDPVATAVAVTEGLGLILPMSRSRSRSAASPSSVENAVEAAPKSRSRTPSPSHTPEQDQEQKEPQQQARPRTRTPDSVLTSSTAVPLTFRPPPPTPGVRRMSSPAITTPSPTTLSPTRSRHRRLHSTEFKNVREWRPLWLVERHSPGKHETEPEGPLPSLPSSKTSSRSASDEDLRGSSPRKDGPPSWPFQDPDQLMIKRRGSFGPRISTDQGPAYDQEDGTLGPQHLTPTAVSFMPTRPPPKKRVKYEFHSPSELLQGPSVFAELSGSTTLGKLPSIESSTVGGKEKGKEKEDQAPENKAAVQEHDLDLDLDLENLPPLPESWPSSPTVGAEMEQETAASPAAAHDWEEGGASSPSPPAVPEDEQVPRFLSPPMDESEFAAVVDAAMSSADEKMAEPEDENGSEQAEQVPVTDTTAPAVDEHEERQRASSLLALTPEEVLGSVSPPMSESRFLSILDATLEEAARLTEAVKHSPLLAGPEAEPESRSVPPSPRTGGGFGFGWRDIVDVVTSTVESFAHGKQPEAGHETVLPQAEKEEMKEKDQKASKPEVDIPGKEEEDIAAEKIPGDLGDEDPFITDVDAGIADAGESTVDKKPATGDESVPMQVERKNEQDQASKPDVVGAPVMEEDSSEKIAEEKAAGKNVTGLADSNDGVNDNIFEDYKREISNEVPKDVWTVEESTPTATAEAAPASAPAPGVTKDMSSEDVKKSVEHATETPDTSNAPDTAAETQEEATPFKQVADPEPEMMTTSESMPEAGKEIISDETRQPAQSATEGQETPPVVDTAPKAEPFEQVATPGSEPEETAQDDILPPDTAASVSKKKRNKRRRKDKGSLVFDDHQPCGDTSKPEDIEPSREPKPVSEEREAPPKTDDGLSREMVSEQEGEEPASTADILEPSRELERVPLQPAIPAIHVVENNDDSRLLPRRTCSHFDPTLPQFRPDHELIDDEQVSSPPGAEEQEPILSFDSTLPQFRPDHEVIDDEQVESSRETEHKRVSPFDPTLPQHRPNDDLIDDEQIESSPGVEEQEPVESEDEGDASLNTASEDEPAKPDSSLDEEAEPGAVPRAEDEEPVKRNADSEASRKFSSEEPAKQDSSEEDEAREPAPLTDVEVPADKQPTGEAEETKYKDISPAFAEDDTAGPGPIELAVEDESRELAGKQRKKTKKAKRESKGSSLSEDQQQPEAASELEDAEPSREPEPAPQEKDEPPKPEAEVSRESLPEEEKEEPVKPGAEADVSREAGPPEDFGKPDSNLSLEREADARELLSAAKEQAVEQPATEAEESSDDDASLVHTEDVAKAGPAAEKTAQNESHALTKKERRKRAKKREKREKRRRQKEAAALAEAAIQKPDLEDRQSCAPAEVSLPAAVSEEQVSAPAEPSLSEAGQDQPLSAPADASVPEQIPENLQPSIPEEQCLQELAPQDQSLVTPGAHNVEPEKAPIGVEFEAGDKAIDSKEPSAAPCVGKHEAAAADNAPSAASRPEQKSEPDPTPGSDVQVAQPVDEPSQTNPEEKPQEKSKDDNEETANRTSLGRQPDDSVFVEALAGSGEAHEAAQPTPAADAVEPDAGDDTILDESKQPSLSPVENEPEESNGDQPHVLAQTDLVPALEPWGSTPPTKNEDKKKKRQVPALVPRQHEEGLESESPVPVGETTVDTVADTTVPAQLVPQLTSQEPEQQLDVEDDTQAKPETKTNRGTAISDEQAQVAVAEEESKMSPAQIEKTKDEVKSPSARPSQVFEELARNAFARPAAPAQSSSSVPATETEAPAAAAEELPTTSGQEAQTSDETKPTPVPHKPSPSQVPPTEDPVKDEASGSQSAKSKKRTKKDKKKRQSQGLGDEEGPASSANPEDETEQRPAEPESSLPTTTEPKPAVAGEDNGNVVAAPAEQAEDEKPAERAIQDEEEQPEADAPSTEPANEGNDDDAQPSSSKSKKKKKAKKDKKKRQSQFQQPSEDAKAPSTQPDESAIAHEKGTLTADDPNVEEKKAEPSAADESGAKDKGVVEPSEAAVPPVSEQSAESLAEELQPATSDEKEGRTDKEEQSANTDVQAAERAETEDTTEPVKQDDPQIDNAPSAPAADTELVTAVVEPVDAPELEKKEEQQVEELTTAEAAEPAKYEQKGDDLSASSSAAEHETDSPEPEVPQSAEPEPEKDKAEDMPAHLESETPAAVPKASHDESTAGDKETEPETTSTAPKDEQAPIPEAAPEPEPEAAPTTETKTPAPTAATPESARKAQGEDEEKIVPEEGSQVMDDKESAPQTDTLAVAEEGFMSAKARKKKAKKEKKKRQSTSLQDDAPKATADEKPADEPKQDEPSASAAPDQAQDTIEAETTPSAEKNTQERAEAPQEPETTASPPRETHGDKDGKEEQYSKNYDNQTEEKEKGPEQTNEMPSSQVDEEQQPEVPLASEATTTPGKIAEELTATSPACPLVEEPELNAEQLQAMQPAVETTEEAVKGPSNEQPPAIDAEQAVGADPQSEPEPSSPAEPAAPDAEDPSQSTTSAKKKKKDKKKAKAKQEEVPPEGDKETSEPTTDVAAEPPASVPIDNPPAVGEGERTPATVQTKYEQPASAAVESEPATEPELAPSGEESGAPREIATEPEPEAEPAQPAVEQVVENTPQKEPAPFEKSEKDKQVSLITSAETDPVEVPPQEEKAPAVEANAETSVPTPTTAAGDDETVPAAEPEPAETETAAELSTTEPEPQTVSSEEAQEPAEDVKGVADAPAAEEPFAVPITLVDEENEKAGEVEKEKGPEAPPATEPAAADATVGPGQEEPAVEAGETQTAPVGQEQPSVGNEEEARELPPQEEQPEEQMPTSTTSKKKSKKDKKKKKKESVTEETNVSTPAPQPEERVQPIPTETETAAEEVEPEPNTALNQPHVEVLPAEPVEEKAAEEPAQKASQPEELAEQPAGPTKQSAEEPSEMAPEPEELAEPQEQPSMEPTENAPKHEKSTELPTKDPMEQVAEEPTETAFELEAEKAAEPAERPAEQIEKAPEPKETVEQPAEEPVEKAPQPEELTEQPAEVPVEPVNPPVEEPTKTAPEPGKSSEPAEQLAEGPTEKVHQPEEPVELPVEKQVERTPEPEEPADDLWTILGFKKKKAKKGKGGQDTSDVPEQEAKDAAPEPLSRKASKKKAKEEKEKAKDDAITETEHKEDPSVPAPLEESPDEPEPVDSPVPAAPLEENIAAPAEEKTPAADAERQVDAPVSLDPVDVPLPTDAQDIQLPTDVPEKMTLEQSTEDDKTQESKEDKKAEQKEEAADQSPPQPEPEAETEKVTEETARTEPLPKKEPEAVQRGPSGAEQSKNEDVPLSTGPSKENGKEREDTLDFEPEIETKPEDKDAAEQTASDSKPKAEDPAEPRPLTRQGSILWGWFRRATQPSTDDSAATSKALNELAEEETENRDSAIPVSEASHNEPARDSGHTRSERTRGGRPAWDISVEVDPTYNISILSDGPDGDSDSVEIRWDRDRLRQRRSLESADTTPRADIDKTKLRRAATFHGRHDGPRPWTPERETSLTPPRTPLDPIREEPHGSAAGASTARGGTPRKASAPGPLIRASPDRPRQGSVGSASSVKSPATPPPSLRRASRVTGDLRTAASRHEQEKAADAEREGSQDEQHKDPQAPSDLDLVDINLERMPSSSTYDPVTDKGKRPLRGMTDVYEGWGENPGSPRSPSRPHSIRRRRSILQVQELEARLEQLISENRLLAAAKEEAESRLAKVSVARRKSDQALNDRDADIRDKEAEIHQLQSSVDWLRGEVARLTASNDEITAQRENAVQELQDLRSQHGQLAACMEDIVRDHIHTALGAKNQEMERLRGELQSARDTTRALQRQLTAAMSSRDDDDVLTVLDAGHFEAACQKLCHHVQQWVVRFSKHSDLRRCRMLHEVRDDQIADRFDSAVLDGTDVDTYLADRVRRRDVFMAVVMAMVWDFVFTRYLFGMDREQRQRLKSLEKQLSEVGTQAAVQRWRATTLTLLAQRPSFEQQLARDIEAVAREIFGTLSRLLPPPPAAEGKLLESLRRLLTFASRLSIEMRTQRAEYVMLPPLQPEHDEQGELVRTVRFKASLMNERGGAAVANEALEQQQAIVRMVLFPPVVKRGDDRGEGDDEMVVYPAQVLVARDGTSRLASSERTDTPSDMI